MTIKDIVLDKIQRFIREERIDIFRLDPQANVGLFTINEDGEIVEEIFIGRALDFKEFLKYGQEKLQEYSRRVLLRIRHPGYVYYSFMGHIETDGTLSILLQEIDPFWHMED